MTLDEAKAAVQSLTETQEKIKANIDTLITESSRIAQQLRELSALSRSNRQALVEAMQEVARLKAEEQAAADAEAAAQEQQPEAQAEQPPAE